jgi:hypothetical protein
MAIWLALLIPAIGAFILLKWFKKHLAWWEIFLPFAVTFLFIVIFKFSVQKVQVSDTEYWGSTIVKARYYEYWSTWVERTCSYTTCNGYDKDGKCTGYTTHYYDCSYCDENSAYWEVTNSLGQTWRISQNFYNYLMKKWNATPRFIELNRSIDYDGRCGQDGDAYEIVWDRQWYSAESTTTEHFYENRVQAAHSAFDFADVSKEDVKTYSLQEYPKVDGFQQTNILGDTSIPWFTSYERGRLYQWGMYMNGELGPKKEARIYYIFFKDQPALAGKMQEAYWDGSNKNEMVICIGLSSRNKELQWVYPFSWTPNRRILVDLREDIMTQKIFNIDSIAQTTIANMEKTWKRKEFEEFSYITVEPPHWAKVTTWIVAIVITVLVAFWVVNNQFEADPENALKTRDNSWDRFYSNSPWRRKM